MLARKPPIILYLWVERGEYGEGAATKELGEGKYHQGKESNLVVFGGERAAQLCSWKEIHSADVVQSYRTIFPFKKVIKPFFCEESLLRGLQSFWPSWTAGAPPHRCWSSPLHCFPLLLSQGHNLKSLHRCILSRCDYHDHSYLQSHYWGKDFESESRPWFVFSPTWLLPYILYITSLLYI